MEPLFQIVLLLLAAVVAVTLCQRWRIPAALGYLLVGVLLGPHTSGWTLDMAHFQTIAQFGVVFLLFSIGLNYSMPQLRLLRYQIWLLGLGQVLLTLAAVAFFWWVWGGSWIEAIVVGAIFAQSSSTIIARQLQEQRQLDQPHGRLAMAISVFQDITAVPLLIILPLLGTVATMTEIDWLALATELGLALAKAAAAVLFVFWFSRKVLHRLFRFIAQYRCIELFTLTVLLVVLATAAATDLVGLSLSFGAFLAGMLLGETEFRHQVEAAIQPFRDVLLGLFFIGVGSLFNPTVLWSAWPTIVWGVLLMLLGKGLIVWLLLRGSGQEAAVAIRTALILALGGEFGFALLEVALVEGALSLPIGQVILSVVLLSMLAGIALIRYNETMTKLFAVSASALPYSNLAGGQHPPPTVVIGGYGRVGHAVAVLLQAKEISFVAFDLSPERVAQGVKEGYPVHLGDITDPGLLTAAQVDRSRLAIVTVGDAATALRAVAALRHYCPQVMVLARAHDLRNAALLAKAGAHFTYPETVEASLRLGAEALRLLAVDQEEIEALVQAIQRSRYQPLAEEKS